MNTSSINALLRDHVLYRLQDKDSGAVQGFAFVKNGQDTPENLKEINFVPGGDDIINPVAEGNDNHLATSVTDLKEEGKNSFPTPNLSKQQKPPPVMDTLETDLNLSEASSTNETTIEECLSQSSLTSPLLLPRQHPSEQDDIPSKKSLSLQSGKSLSTTDDISSSSLTSHLLSHNEVKVKTENTLNEQLSEIIKTEVKDSDSKFSSSQIEI